jgi:hypothetical protein
VPSFTLHPAIAPHRELSFRGSAALHSRLPGTRGATEKSTVGMPVSGSGAPALALSGLVVTARLARAAASGHRVAEIGFLGPATRVASRKCGAAGPRNDTPVYAAPETRRVAARCPCTLNQAIWCEAILFADRNQRRQTLTLTRNPLQEPFREPGRNGGSPTSWMVVDATGICAFLSPCRTSRVMASLTSRMPWSRTTKRSVSSSQLSVIR